MEVYDEIKKLATNKAVDLRGKVQARIYEMQSDDTSHYLIYKVLGISHQEGELIDIYQNKGRFLYKHAGAFLEEAVRLCFKSKYPDSAPLRIENTNGTRPRTYEIDCLVGSDAIEIKWRDATTDGDHIIKEHLRLQAISRAGFCPVRIMFYYPNRQQAIQVQKTLETVYEGLGGKYYYGGHAWQYVKERTGVDLLAILQEIAGGNDNEN